LGIADVLHRDPIIPDFRTFPLELPKLSLLTGPVSVNKEVAHRQMHDHRTRVVQRLAHDDYWAIGSIRQMQDRSRSGTRQSLKIAF